MKKHLLGLALVLVSSPAFAQEEFPQDSSLAASSYHTAPRYRSSEEHPFRILSYVLNPIGWVVREGITRPLSFFASSTETTRNVMGYREPMDWRQPECFSGDDTTPDCRSIMPYNYEDAAQNGQPGEETASISTGDKFVYFPDVNFDFNKASLNDLGLGRVHQIARLLDKERGVTVMLEGHADFKGSEDFNKKLGLNRAQAVRQALVDLGVDSARLSTVSFGEGSPVFGEETDWARAVNRRVGVRSVE
jgi:outer membrane protein OmpA-like peptidoglycan-associated protein